MREIVGKCFVALGVGIAVVMAQGCWKQAAAAPAQSVVRYAPRVQPDFPVGSLPAYTVDPVTRPPSLDRVALVRPQEQPAPTAVPVQSADDQAAAEHAAAVAEAQREHDERLLEEQQAESVRQQQELNQEIEQETRRQQEVEAEPRIQDNTWPEGPVQQPLPQ